MKKRVLGLCILALLLAVLLPALGAMAAGRATVTLGNGAPQGPMDAFAAWAIAAGARNTAGATFQLNSDWVADASGTSTFFGRGVGFRNTNDRETGIICVPADKTITIDLNGFSIDRRMSGATLTSGSYGVIEVGGGTLTIKNSVPASGRITGSYRAPAINALTRVDFDISTTPPTITQYIATLNLQSGAINGNSYAISGGSGGGVMVGSGATFNMTGGSITGNTAGSGGGVYVKNRGIFNFSAGEIRNNRTIDESNAEGGGIAVAGTLNMTGAGCVVNNNTAGSFGGGISVLSGGAASITGGSIGSNSAGQKGGGIFTNGVLTLSDVVIRSNELTDSRSDRSALNGAAIFCENTGGSYPRSTTLGGRLTIENNKILSTDNSCIALKRNAFLTIAPGGFTSTVPLDIAVQEGYVEETHRKIAEGGTAADAARFTNADGIPILSVAGTPHVLELFRGTPPPPPPPTGDNTPLIALCAGMAASVLALALILGRKRRALR